MQFEMLCRIYFTWRT